MSNEQTKKQPEAQTESRAIRNISALSTKALRKRLVEAGLEVPARANRARLIELARTEGLWKYDGDQVPSHYKAKYGKEQSCGDDVAGALKDQVTGSDGKCDPVALLDVAEANGIDLKRWQHLNIGMQRMNLGNVLRGMVKRGEYVIVGTTDWNQDAA